MTIELDAQEYKDILSTVDVYKKGVSIQTSKPYELDGVQYTERDLYIGDVSYMQAIQAIKENGETTYQYFLLRPIPPEYQTEASFTATVEVENWDTLKDVLIAAGVAK